MLMVDVIRVLLDGLLPCMQCGAFQLTQMVFIHVARFTCSKLLLVQLIAQGDFATNLRFQKPCIPIFRIETVSASTEPSE